MGLNSGRLHDAVTQGILDTEVATLESAIDDIVNEGASAGTGVTIADAGEYYDGENAETVLQEVGAQLSAKANKDQGTVITPTLINGWAVFNGLTPRYRRDDLGRLSFYGSLQGGSAGTVAFVLEATHRPTLNHLVMVRSASGKYSALQISTDGTVTVQSVDTYLSLDGLNILRSWA